MIHRIPGNNPSSLWKREGGRDFSEMQGRCRTFFLLPQETRLTFRGAASQMAAQATEKRTVATTKARK